MAGANTEQEIRQWEAGETGFDGFLQQSFKNIKFITFYSSYQAHIRFIFKNLPWFTFSIEFSIITEF